MITTCDASQVSRGSGAADTRAWKVDRTTKIKALPCWEFSLKIESRDRTKRLSYSLSRMIKESIRVAVQFSEKGGYLVVEDGFVPREGAWAEQFVEGPTVGTPVCAVLHQGKAPADIHPDRRPSCQSSLQEVDDTWRLTIREQAALACRSRPQPSSPKCRLPAPGSRA